jgi:hypothetical protein
VSGLPAEAGVAYLAEGTLKPKLAALLHDEYFIGASSGNFASSPIQVRSALIGYHTVVITVDGGDAINSHRITHWERQAIFLIELGLKVKFAWWGQVNKDNNDVDEINTEVFRAAKWLNLKEFLKICHRSLAKIKDDQLFKTLGTLTKAVTDERNEQYLSALPLPRPGYYNFISSPVCTGKTEQLSVMVAGWDRMFPGASVLVLGYRNGLLEQSAKRIGIPLIRDLKAIAGYYELGSGDGLRAALCLDSLMKLSIELIPAHTLIIHDEVEAILAHAAIGGTLGANAAKVQAHLVAIYHKAMSTGGSVVALEDSLTDLSIDGLLDLTDRKYPYELLVNRFERFNWEVSIGSGKSGEFMGLIIDRLLTGERIVVPTTSQVFGECLERIILARHPEIVIGRVDAKTVGNLKELIVDPTAYLENAKIQLLILSPTVESGFSIADFDLSLFDRVMAYCTNLDTRSQIQLLSRLRSNCPREIFALEKGAEAGEARGRDPVKLLKVRKDIANQTLLAHGVNNNRLTGGTIWNRLDAQFSARTALSAKYLKDYLKTELIDRGHRVAEANWESVRASLANSSDRISSEELSAEYKSTKALLETEEAYGLNRANGKSMSPDHAVSLLHSSYSTYESKIVAKKCLLHRDLPGAELTEEFLLEAIVKRRGQYRRECELNYFLDKPLLAKILDRDILEKQLDQPHLLWSRTPKMGLRMDLLQPIVKDLADLATGRKYTEQDPAVIEIQKFAVRKSYLFSTLFSLTIGDATELKCNGTVKNTAISTANKILKRLSYKAECVERIGPRGDRQRVYAVVNHDCEHRSTIETALNQRYADLIAKVDQEGVSTLFIHELGDIKKADTPYCDPALSDENVESVRDALAIVVDLSIEDALDGLADLRSAWRDKILLQRAANLLSVEQRSKLKQIVTMLNREVA